MKLLQITTCSFSLLALMSFGCASTGPSASNGASLSPELEQAQTVKNSDKENYAGWGLLYSALLIGGTCLGGK
jgi:hypothetical protein